MSYKQVEKSPPLEAISTLKMPHPYREAFLPLIGLLALVSLLALGGGLMVGLGLWKAHILLYLALPPLLVSVALIVTLIAGIIRNLEARAFLHSQRPLLCWQYTPEEWAGVKARAEKSFHKFLKPYGATPGIVALGHSEFYVNGHYFKAGASTILSVEFMKDFPRRLVITTQPWYIYPPKHRWVIEVPLRLLEVVEAIIPEIEVSGEDYAAEEYLEEDDVLVD